MTDYTRPQVAEQEHAREDRGKRERRPGKIRKGIQKDGGRREKDKHRVAVEAEELDESHCNVVQVVSEYEVDN